MGATGLLKDKKVDLNEGEWRWILNGRNVGSDISLKLEDMDEIRGYSIIYKNKTIDIDDAALRKRYFIQDTGDEKNETIFNSRISRRVADLSTLTIDLERNLPVLNLIQVGECVKFKPLTTEYADLEGKYILWSTDIWFRRENNWQTTAQVKLMRTNKRAGDTVKPKADPSVLPLSESARKAAKKISNQTGQTVDQVIENARKTLEQNVEQVTQRTGQIAKPYQEQSSTVLDEIKANQQKIVELQEKVDRYNSECNDDLQLSQRGICNPRAHNVRVKQIERLQKRNTELSIQGRFS